MIGIGVKPVGRFATHSPTDPTAHPSSGFTLLPIEPRKRRCDTTHGQGFKIDVTHFSLHAHSMIWLAWMLVVMALGVLLRNERWVHLPISSQLVLLSGGVLVYIGILYWLRRLRNQRAIFLLVDALNRGEQGEYLQRLAQMEQMGAATNRRSIVDYCRILRASGLNEFGQVEAAYEELKRIRPQRLHPSHALAWQLEMGNALAARNQPALAQIHLNVLQQSTNPVAQRVLVPLLRSKIAAASGHYHEAATELLAVAKTMRKHPILRHTADRTQLEAAELFAAAGAKEVASRIANEVYITTRYSYLRNRAQTIGA